MHCRHWYVPPPFPDSSRGPRHFFGVGVGRKRDTASPARLRSSGSAGWPAHWRERPDDAAVNRLGTPRALLRYSPAARPSGSTSASARRPPPRVPAGYQIGGRLGEKKKDLTALSWHTFLPSLLPDQPSPNNLIVVPGSPPQPRLCAYPPSSCITLSSQFFVFHNGCRSGEGRRPPYGLRSLLPLRPCRCRLLLRHPRWSHPRRCVRSHPSCIPVDGAGDASA